MKIPRPDPESLLLPPIRAGLGLVLLTPLVTAVWTLYPFSVGKALYARGIIAVIAVLWVVLAVARPQWRPPGSLLLAALGAGLFAAVLAAGFGVSPQLSFWSTYTRMQGTVNAAHWIAFAVILVAVVRTTPEWIRLLNINLGVGLCMALLAIARSRGIDMHYLIPGPEAHWPRIGASAGNPIFLGAYLQAITLLAIGLLIRSCCAAPASDPGSGAGVWGARLFWAATACCALTGVALTGSLGALAGLVAGSGTAAVYYACLGRTRRSRRLGLAGLAGLALGVLALTSILVARGIGDDTSSRIFDNAMLERATSASEIESTSGGRLRNWAAGLRAFADRPLLGWGPDNYFVASGHHLSPPEGRARVRDHAHNLFVEEAATKGLMGVATWVALWAVTVIVVVRAARRLEDSRTRTLAVFAGAALVGWFVQGCTSFYTASTWLQHMLLLGFLGHLEVTMRSAENGPALSVPVRRRQGGALSGISRMPVLAGIGRVLAVTAALGAAGASLASSHAIHAGAVAMWKADHVGPFLDELGRAITVFEPLATGPRIVLFNNLALNWEWLDGNDPDKAARLLAQATVEAEAAIAGQPENWVLHHALARLYLKVADTHPDYAARAQHHFARSLVLAPNLDPMEAPVPQ